MFGSESHQRNGRVELVDAHAALVLTVVTLVCVHRRLEVFVRLADMRVQVQQFVLCLKEDRSVVSFENKQVLAQVSTLTNNSDEPVRLIRPPSDDSHRLLDLQAQLLENIKT